VAGGTLWKKKGENPDYRDWRATIRPGRSPRFLLARGTSPTLRSVKPQSPEGITSSGASARGRGGERT